MGEYISRMNSHPKMLSGPENSECRGRRLIPFWSRQRCGDQGQSSFALHQWTKNRKQPNKSNENPKTSGYSWSGVIKCLTTRCLQPVERCASSISHTEREVRGHSLCFSFLLLERSSFGESALCDVTLRSVPRGLGFYFHYFYSHTL